MIENKPILIVGLGNPGSEYKATRHNAGFIAVDFFAGESAVWKKEKNALTTRDGNIIFAKPQTFMNLSGNAVGALMAFYKIPIENLIVIHDDMDLKLGDIRTKIGGSSAGHNGIKSIDAAVGPEYTRVRIGVGRPPENYDPANWVTGKFTKSELSEIQKTIAKLKL